MPEEAPVKAADLAPAAYADEPSTDKFVDLECDLRLLCANDSHPVDREAMAKEGRETYLKDNAQKTVYELIKQLFELPVEKSDTGPLAMLPKFPTMVLPREKPVPQQKPETKWEKFAKEKGIQKKKKSRMVWDEANQIWAPRWGYKRANQSESGIVELKTGQDADDSLFKGGKAEKVAKNVANRKKNLQRAQKDGYTLPSGIAPELMTRSGTAQGILTKKQRGKEGTRAALQGVQMSTASIGKFDVKRQGEPLRTVANKRRKFQSSTSNWQEEKNRTMDVLTRVLNPNKVQADSGMQNGKKDRKAAKRATKSQLKKKGDAKGKRVKKGKGGKR